MDRHKTYTDMLMRHRAMVWRMCLRRARGDIEASRDLMQDVSLSLWEHFGDLRQGCLPLEERAWVYWHTRTVLDHSCRRPRLPMQPLTPAIANSTAAPDDGLSLDELTAHLPPDDRRLVRLRVEGYNADEIAADLGTTRDAVYQRMHRIRILLRALLVLAVFVGCSAIAVSVNPRLHRLIFPPAEPESHTPPPQPKAEPRPVVDTVVAPVKPTAPRRPVADTADIQPLPPVETLTAADTQAAPPLPLRWDVVVLDDDSTDAESTELPQVTISVSRNRIDVEGADDDIVDVFDDRGRLVVTGRCNNGYCSLTVHTDINESHNVLSASAVTYWVQVGSRPRQRVVLGAIPRRYRGSGEPSEGFLRW